MISAVALTTLIPFATRAGTAQADWPGHVSKGYGLKQTYGYAKISGIKNGVYKTGHGAGMGIKLNEGNGNNASQWAYDHKASGFLQPISNKNGMTAEPFGPRKSSFQTSKEGKNRHTWVVYTARDSEAGKVGMLYKNALWYYPNGYKKRVKLDAKLTWNGSYRPWTHGKMVNVQFATTDIAIKEPWSGAANFSLILYKAGTKTPYAVHSFVAQSDIDYNQGILFDTPMYMATDTNAKLNGGPPQGVNGFNWPTYVAGKSQVFGDDGTNLPDHQGTVYANDHRGWFSYLPKSKQSTYNVTFVHGIAGVPWKLTEKFHPVTSSEAVPSTYSLKKIKRGPNDLDSGHYYKDGQKGGQADLFGFDFEGTNIPYKVPIDKWVSKKKGSFKPDSKKNPLEINDTQHAYFDVHTALKTPSIAYVSSKNEDSDYNGLPLKSAIKTQDDPVIKKLVPDAKKHKQRLVLRDYIDPRLKVVGAHVYSSSWGDKHGKNLKSTSAFKVGTGTATGEHDGYTVVDAVMTDHAAKASTHDTWGKNYHLVIEVAPKPNQLPEHSGPEPWTVISNEASLNDSYADAWSYLKVNFKKEDKDTKHDEKSNATLDSQKYVYRADLADKDKRQSGNIDDAKSTKLEHLVHPNEYLYYRLAFKLQNFTELDKKEAKDGKVYGDDDAHSKLINHRYKNFVITDTLSDKFRNKLDGLSERQVDKVHISLKNSDLLDGSTKHDFKVVGGNKLQIKLNNKDDGIIYVQYRVQIRPNEVSDDANKNLKPLNLKSTAPITTKSIMIGYWSSSNTYRGSKMYATENPALAEIKFSQ